MILAIDPGPTQSAFVLYDPSTRRLDDFKKLDNATAVGLLGAQLAHMFRMEHAGRYATKPMLVVEMIASYGMPVGREVFDTCVWIGRFVQAWSGPHELLYRTSIKLHLCGSVRAKDANVRQALLDAFGGKDKAVGTKKQPGPLYGVSGDVWSALAVAVTYADRTEQARAA